MHWYNRFRLQKNMIYGGFWSLIYFVLSITLLYGIVLSQTVSPLYGRLIQDEEKTIGTVLKFTQTLLPDQKRLYLIYKNKYGTKIDNEIFAEKEKNTLYISDLKKILGKNPDSRDVNYNLSQVLTKSGTSGEEYLIRAKQIDPEIQ